MNLLFIIFCVFVGLFIGFLSALVLYSMSLLSAAQKKQIKINGIEYILTESDDADLQ